jgi:hypothetical protein
MDVAIMPANRAQIPSAVSAIAVSETVKQVSAKAFDLSTRRKEIVRRIGFLNNVMKRLRDVATHTTNIDCAIVPTAFGDVTDPSTDPKSELTRACRIALVEAGGRASIDEIRRRIVRRESFWFADPGSAKAAIHEILKAMTVSGEVRRLDNGSKSLWLRNAPEWEGDRKAVQISPTIASQPGENTNTLSTADCEAI